MDSRTIREVIIKVNGKDAEQRIANLQHMLAETKKKRDALEEAHPKGAEWTQAELKEYEKLSRQLDTTRIKMARLGANAEEAGEILSRLSKSSVRELNSALKTLERAIKDVPRGSAEWKTLTEAIARTKQELEDVNEQHKAIESAGTKISSWGTKWVGFSTIIHQTADALSSMAGKVFGFYEQFAEMQEHMASVRKYAGLTDSAVRELNESFKAMDTRTSREQLNDLAGDAGRLGIQGKKGILEFVEAADQINVALGEDLGEDAVKNIGKLAQLFGDADRMGLKQAMLSTGSVINELAQSSSASEGYLMDFTARLAGVSKQAGLTQAQVMAFGSVLDQSMVGVEKGATALQNVITALYAKPSEMAKTAGLDVKKFTELLKTDGNAAVLQFISALNQTGGFDRLAPLLKEMELSGAGVTQTLSALANNLTAVTETQEQATEAFREGTSITKEFGQANDTVQAKLDKAKKKSREMAVTLGEQLAPVAEQMLSLSSSIMRILSTLIPFIARNAKQITVLAAVIATYTAMVNLATVKTALLSAAQKVLATTTTLLNGAMSIGRSLALTLSMGYYALRGNVVALRAAQIALNRTLIANPYAAVAAAVIALGSAIYLWATREKELTAEQKIRQGIMKDNAELERKGSEAIAGTQTKINLLTAIIHDNNRKLSERRAAINELKKIIPEYNAMINNEGILTEENTKAIGRYIEKLKQKAIIEAAQDKLKDIAKQRLDINDRGYSNAISIRKDRLARFRKENKEFTDFYDKMEAQAVAGDTGAASTLAGLSVANRKGREYKKLKDQLDEANGWMDGANERIKALDARSASLTNRLKSLGVKLSDIVGATSTTPSGEGGGKRATQNGGGATSVSKDDPVKKEFNRLSQQAEASRLAAQTQYEAGIIEHREYAEQLMLIDEQLYASQRDLYEKGTPEWVEMERKRLDAVEAQKKQYNAWSISDIDRQEREETENVQDNYAHGLLNEEQYQHALTDVKLKYLKQRADMSRDWGQTEEAAKYDLQYEEASQNEQIQRQKEFWQKVDSFKSEFLRQSEEEQRQAEMTFADKLHEEGLLSEEEYQKAKAEIEKKYSKDQATDLGRPTDSMSQSIIGVAEALKNLHDKLKDGKANWQDYAAAGMAAMQTVMACMQSASQLMQANLSLEEAKITKRYNKEIEAAGSNTAKGKKLEEQKQKEIAKIKTKYNKKQMAMEIASATAQMAMNALQAYGAVVGIKVVGPVLAPIAAAAALAAGAIQIAAIKKQHAAEAAGYYEGGFTGGNSYRRTAGIVHEGEFVANHQAVSNPNVLPILQLIDHAQRTNRIASLTAADVSRVVAAPMATSANTAATASAPALQVIDTSRADTAEAIQRLNDQLEQGIEAMVVLDGPDGLDWKLTRYRRMKNRK